MDTGDKLIEALLFAGLGVLFYWWQMRQIRTDRRKAAEQAAARALEQAAPQRESAPGDPRT